MTQVARWCILDTQSSPVQIVAQDSKGGWTTDGGNLTNVKVFYPETFVAPPAVFCNSSPAATDNIDGNAQWGNINSYSITECSPRGYGATSSAQSFRFLTVVAFGELAGPPYSEGVQPWIPNTLASWTFPLATSTCTVPDYTVDGNFTGTGGTNRAVSGTGIVGDAYGMGDATDPSNSQNNAFTDARALDKQAIFVQARVRSASTLAQYIMGCYSATFAYSWEFGVDANGFLSVGMAGGGLFHKTSFTMPRDNTWHDIVMQSNPELGTLTLGLDGQLETFSGLMSNLNYNYLAVMAARTTQQWRGECTQVRIVNELVLRPGETTYEPGDYEYLSGPP